MGLNAGLYIIPAKKFAAAQAKESWDRHHWHKCRPWFDLDKAWDEFDSVLKRRSASLACAIWGDIRLSPRGLGFNLVSPDVARRSPASSPACRPRRLSPRSSGTTGSPGTRPGVRRNAGTTRPSSRSCGKPTRSQRRGARPWVS